MAQSTHYIREIYAPIRLVKGKPTQPLAWREVGSHAKDVRRAIMSEMGLRTGRQWVKARKRLGIALREARTAS